MLKSLEKLRELYADELADEIQAEVDEKYMPRVGAAYQMLADPKLDDDAVNSAYEILKEYGTLDAYIDKFYLPRPLFEDGEPVQFGDEFIGDTGTKWKVQTISVFDTGTVMIGDGGWRIRLESGDRLKRPPDPDSQEKIDEDYRNETNSLITDSGRGCMTRERALKYVERFDELMARQRKLDGVE